MRLLVLGDIHAKEQGKRIDGLTESVYYAKTNIYKAAEIAINKKCDYVVLLGDILDNKKFIEQETYTNMMEYITFLSDKIPVIIVVGNHDYIMVNNQISWLYKLNNNRIQVTKENQVLQIDNCMFVGHHQKEVLQQLVQDNMINAEIIFGHFGLDEGVLSNNYRIRAEFSVKDFEIYTDEKLFVLGHYHKPQELKTSKNKFIYVGSLIPARIDEVFDEKRMMYIDTETKEYEFIPTEYSRWIKVEIDENTDISKFIDGCTNIINNNNKVYIISKVVLDKRITDFVSENRYNVYIKVDISKKENVGTEMDINTEDIREINLEQLVKNYCIENNCFDEEAFDELIKVVR